MKEVRIVLEYLLNFLGKNILMILFVAFILTFFSVYSKKSKFIFILTLCGASTCFILLYLYRLKIGIESLYDWSLVVCMFNQMDYYEIFFLNHFFVLTKEPIVFIRQTFSQTILLFVQIYLMFLLITLFIEVLLQKGLILFDRIKLQTKKNNNKKIYLSNTINRTQFKFILNSVLRC